MDRSYPGARPREARRPGGAAKSEARRRRLDRWLVAVATLIAVGLVASFWFITDVPAALGWSAQVLLLCLVITAGAGRVLLGPSPRAAERAGSGRIWDLLAGWPVVALAAIVPYLRSLGAGFLSDDFGLYYGASHATSVGHVLSTQALPGFLRPMAILLWWVGAKLWGGAPAGYHAMSLLLHATNAVLVCLLGRRWIGSAYGGFLAGLLFALHPLHVEAVVWASCSPDLLCTCFCLLSLLGAEVALTAATRRRCVAAMAAGCAAFWLALMSKEAALALPGVVFLLALLRDDSGRWPFRTPKRLSGFQQQALRATALTAPYVLLIVGYLAWRLASLGSLGGYQVRLNLWNTLFPSAPLRHLAVFFFPVNRMLVGALHQPWLYYAMALAMVAGLHWWLRHLSYLPGKRLVLWVGFLFVTAVPVWAFPTATPDLQHSRFSYLPTIGLAWLFGDLCAGKGANWRRSGGFALATLVLAGALTAWYVSPWIAAHRQAEKITAAATKLLGRLEHRQEHFILYVQGMPNSYLGAQLFANCLPQAVSLGLGREAPVRAITEGGEVSGAIVALSTLLPGEYLAAWQNRSGEFAVLRSGGSQPTHSPADDGREPKSVRQERTGAPSKEAPP